MNLILLAGISIWFPLASLEHRLDLRGEPTLWECSSPKWVEPPTMEGGKFRGKIKGECLIQTREVNNYKKLAQGIAEEIVVESKTVHSGPESEIYEELPSVVLDVTTAVNEQGLNSIRSDIHLPSDQDKYLAFITLSKKISATGLAAQLEKLNTRTEMKLLDSTHHKMVLYNENWVNKPPLAPEGIFKKEVIKQIETNFRDNLPKSAKAMFDSLQN